MNMGREAESNALRNNITLQKQVARAQNHVYISKSS